MSTTQRTPVTELTANEAEALRAVKAAASAINRPWHTLTMVHEFAEVLPHMLADGIAGLRAKGLIRQSGDSVMLLPV
jgi:putative heme degradation protein